MTKKLLLVLPLMLTGCSYYNNFYHRFVDNMNTDTLEYQCDEKPLTIHQNNDKQEVSFIFDNKNMVLKQGISASGVRYSDGIYVFWSKGNDATVYYQDRIVLNNCQLQTPRR